MVKILGHNFGEAKQAVAERALGADRIHLKEADKGTLQTGYSFEDRIPHPQNMDRYEDWSKDPEASIALEVLTNIIAGVGFYTEMPDDLEVKKDKNNKPTVHTNKVKVDEFAENTNLDEKLCQITWNMIAKGFCPVEVLSDYRLKVLPPETFYMYRDSKGTVTKYTQERSRGDELASWKTTAEMQSILIFINEETPARPYGLSLLDPIGALLDGRSQLNTDVMKGVHRWANPIPIMETAKSKDNSKELKDSLTDRDVDDWVLIYNVNKDEIRWNPLTVTPAKDFISFTDLIYTQICEGLHAPLLLYLKNATEASATVMMESVDRFVSGKQRYIKRRIEKTLFEPLTGDPVPRMMWGKPQTGLEKVTMSELASLVNSPALANNQKQELLKQYGVKLPEPDWESGPQLQPAAPFGQDQNVKDKKPFGNQQSDKANQDKQPAELFVVEKLNDLDTGLTIIAENFDLGKLKVTDTCQMAERTIRAHMQRAYPDDWQQRTQEAFQKFIRERVVKHSGKPAYRVTIDN